MNPNIHPNYNKNIFCNTTILKKVLIYQMGITVVWKKKKIMKKEKKTKKENNNFLNNK